LQWNNRETFQAVFFGQGSRGTTRLAVPPAEYAPGFATRCGQPLSASARSDNSKGRKRKKREMKIDRAIQEAINEALNQQLVPHVNNGKLPKLARMNIVEIKNGIIHIKIEPFIGTNTLANVEMEENSYTIISLQFLR
jgi:hypothetical protein